MRYGPSGVFRNLKRGSAEVRPTFQVYIVKGVQNLA